VTDDVGWYARIPFFEFNPIAVERVVCSPDRAYFFQDRTTFYYAKVV
jgi:hypothetical protein